MFVPVEPVETEPEPPPPPAAANQETIHDTILKANEVYAAALHEVDPSILEEYWHGEARARWEASVEGFASRNTYRNSNWDIEVVAVYFHDDQTAIGKTIEFWEFEERVQSSDAVESTHSLGPLFETYHLEIVDGRWSIGAIEIFEQPTLTLTEIRGDVFLRGEQVFDKQEVFQGDEIETGPGSMALLLYPFDGTTEIREDGHLLLSRLEIDPNRSAPIRGQVEYELFGTSLWNKLRKLWRSIFSGGGATAVDQPAEFGVTLEDDGTFLVEVQEGEVELISAGVTVVVAAGEQSAAFPGQPPIPPIQWPGPLLVSGGDLVIQEMEIVGSLRFNRSGGIEVPLHVVVRNQGDTEVDRFKLSARYRSSRGEFTVPYNVPETSQEWYPFTAEILPPGGVVSFNGVVVLPEDTLRQTIELTVIADSCDGDEFMPVSCRVEESNEENNTRTIEIQVSVQG